jgi:hypothetical protein
MDRKVQEIHLYAINTASLYTVFTLVSALPLPERYALFTSYHEKGKPKSLPHGHNAYIPCYREKALATIYQGVLKEEIRLIQKRSYFFDRHMSHSQFRGYVDDYLADELHEDAKDRFEYHMLACDFCGALFVINRDIVEIISKCGEDLFEDLVRDETCAINRDIGEPGYVSSPQQEKGFFNSIVTAIKKCPHQFGVTFVVMDSETYPFLRMFLSSIRSISITQHVQGLIRLLAALLRCFIP